MLKCVLIVWVPVLVTAASAADYDVIVDLGDSDQISVAANILTIKRPSGDHFAIPLELVKASWSFYHGGDHQHLDNIAARGHFTEGDLEVYKINRPMKQGYGPGFYVTTEPLAVYRWGTANLQVNGAEDYLVTKGVIFNFTDSEKSFHGLELLVRAGVLGVHVPDVEEWYVLFGEKALSRVRLLDPEAAEAAASCQNLLAPALGK